MHYKDKAHEIILPQFHINGLHARYVLLMTKKERVSFILNDRKEYMLKLYQIKHKHSTQQQRGAWLSLECSYIKIKAIINNTNAVMYSRI